MAEPLKLETGMGDDLSASQPPPAPGRSFFRRPWLYIVLGLLIFWFGTPYLLRLWFLSAPDSGTQAGNFTTAQDLPPTERAGVVDVVTSDDPSQGSPVAPITIVEFGDFQCPFCREAAPIVSQVLAKYPEAVRLIYRDFPLPDVHDQAIAAAEAASCAQIQGQFWQYHDRLFVRQEELGEQLYQSIAGELGLNLEQFNRCRAGHLTFSDIEADFEAGKAAGVGGTPTWFVNGYKLQGALPLEAWDKIVIEVLKRTISQPAP